MNLYQDGKKGRAISQHSEVLVLLVFVLPYCSAFAVRADGRAGEEQTDETCACDVKINTCHHRLQILEMILIKTTNK